MNYYLLIFFICLLGQPDDPHKHRPRPHEQGSSTSHQQKERDYREKKERERLSQHSTKPSFPSNQYNKQPGLHHHVRPPVDPKLKQHSSRLAAASSHPPFVGRPPEPRDILREAAKDLNSRDLKYNRDTNDSSKDVSKDVIMRESVRELQNVRVDIVKRESNVSNFSDPRAIINDKIMDNLRQKQIDPAKYFQKHESLRKSEDSKLNVNIKLENDIKKHIISGSLEKNSLLSKPYLSTSHRVKSPFESENLKFAPKPGSNQANLSLKNLDTHNESTVPAIDTDVKIKIEPKEEIIPVKKPSLFSPERPEKSPKKRSISPIIHSPHNNSNKKLPEDTSLSSILNIPELVSPIESTSISDINKKPRKPSCSEPELRPVMKKIDQVEGFEHLLRDASIGIKMRQVPDIITPIADTKLDKPIQKEFKLPDPTISNSTNLQPLVNGIETNPTLISNLLKEAPTVPTLSSMSVPNTSAIASEKSTEIVDKEREHHHKSKKKNKEKHKHKDKNKDDRDKKKKHKDKDKEKHKNKSDKYEVDSNSSIAQPIKITIPKDKIQPPDNPKPGTGLKIKIPKDRLKSDGINESSPSIPAGSLKIKIPKDVIKSNLGSESRKRDREKASPSVLPPSKALKSSHGSRSNESKQNGRSSYNKVSNNVSIAQTSQSSSNVASSTFQDVKNNESVNCAAPSIPQGYYYNFPPHSMQVPPPNMNINAHHIGMQASYMYDPQIYQQMFANSYMYHPQNIYRPMNSVMSNLPPPLPKELPPDQPPPPPPEF